MYKLLAEFYGLYLERDLGTHKMVLGDYSGKWKSLSGLSLASIAAFRAECENF